ncbi:Neuronal acetylcholine receptor subunit alpha-7 [Nymphon striatum]|nr:Neuronal acetylcholine receptor subunit alpha-7 [Nymphon striatum]
MLKLKKFNQKISLTLVPRARGKVCKSFYFETAAKLSVFFTIKSVLGVAYIACLVIHSTLNQMFVFWKIRIRSFQNWIDVNLRWDESKYDGITDVRIPPHRMWTPDVLMYNSADERFDGTFHTNVILLSNGSCSWVPPGIFKSTCKIDITWFPFDDQWCKLKFGSWTYHQGSLDLRLMSDQGDTESFLKNGEWTLLGFPAERNEKYYNCCPDPYLDATFTIHIRRRTLYYGFNLIIPCVLISSMSLLGFTLPPDSGEKLTLGKQLSYNSAIVDGVSAVGSRDNAKHIRSCVTILLSMTVFMLIVAETMPPTSDAVPLIGTYFACIMIMVAFSVVMTVVVLNYHHRNAESHTMPTWVKSVLLQWLPWILRMDRPGKRITRHTIVMSSKMKDLEMKERNSKSLMANVLDIDDDFRHMNNSTTLSGGPAGCCLLHPQHASLEESVSTIHSCNSIHRELIAILTELKYVTNKMRNDSDAEETASDWKFGAMVVDRLCLILFSIFTVISTCVCILRAENLTE